MDHPTHAYIGRKPGCHCVDAIVSDRGTAHTGEMVSEYIIQAGLELERIAWEDYSERVSKEPSYMNCPHEQDT